jgi:putative acetyltransferase
VAGVIIEPERPEDVGAVDAVVRRAFEHHPGVADMVAAIRRSPRYHPGLAFVARTDDGVVGFVMLSGTDLVDHGGDGQQVLTLTPLTVVPEYQRRGIGSALVRAALHAAERRGEQLVVLEGSPRYYGRLGFCFAGDHGITVDLPDWAPREAAQVFLLPAHDPALRGHVEYPPAIAPPSGPGKLAL